MAPLQLVEDSASPEGPKLTEAISAAMAELYAAFYEHDRATATTYLNDNVVVCVLENILTEGEDALLADGARGEINDGSRFRPIPRMNSPRRSSGSA